MKYLFIAGCARSGTSALAHMIGSNDKIVMGMERFGHLVSPDDFRLTPAHFEKNRFFDVQSGDTFYQDFERFHRFDKNIRDKFGFATYFGDKRPDLYESYDQLYEAFPSAKVLFIYRDVKEVASSYQDRVLKGEDWPAYKNYERAVSEWNRSLYLTREAINKGFDIKVVDYESVFVKCVDIQPIFDWLDLEIDHRMWRKMVEIEIRSKQLQRERKLLLTEDQALYVETNAKRHLVHDLKSAMLLG